MSDRDLHPAAVEMADLYMEGSVYDEDNEMHNVSQETMMRLTMVFGSVPEEERAYVFEDFMFILNAQEHAPDVSQFQATVH